jgi:phospholipid/cholesterol/gamma-HCH transport system substrate-binding protein
MNNVLLSIRVGLTFLIGLGLIWATYETLSESTLFGEKNVYQVRGEFITLKQLKSKDEVRLSGVRIGSVKETRLVNGKAVAILDIEEKYQIPEGSYATIDMAGLLGSNYVAINAPENWGSQFLKPNATIPTQSTPDLNSLLSQVGGIGDKIEGLVSGMSGDEGTGGLTGIFDGVARKIEKVVDDNSANLHAAIENLNRVSANLAEAKGTLGKLINDPEAYDKLMKIATNLESASSDVQGVLADVRLVFEDIKKGEGALGTLIYNKKIGEDIARVTENINKISEQLSSGKGTLGRLIMDDGMYESTEQLISKANKTLDGMGESGPITAVGATAGALF